MKLSMDTIIAGVINKGACNKLFGGKRARGPLRTADFVYEVMIGVALELTDNLPMLFEDCRQDYELKRKWNEKHTTKGKFSDTYGWSKNHEYKHDIDIDPVFHHYFNRIIVPYLGGKKKSKNKENDRLWKYIKKIIISGDKVKITNLQQSIRNRILKESKCRIFSGGGSVGSNDSKIITSTT